MTERVDVLIERVMKAFPGVSALAQSRYYEEVHQELAPLAREIERQRDELLAALRDFVLVVERDLDGLKVVQPELNNARAAIANIKDKT